MGNNSTSSIIVDGSSVVVTHRSICVHPCEVVSHGTTTKVGLAVRGFGTAARVIPRLWNNGIRLKGSSMWGMIMQQRRARRACMRACVCVRDAALVQVSTV